MCLMFVGLVILTLGLAIGIYLLVYSKREDSRDALIGGWVSIGLSLVGSSLFFWPGLSSVYVNKWWFDGLGYVSVFWTILTTRWELFFGFGAVAAIFLSLNSFIANKLAPKTRTEGDWAINNKIAFWLTVSGIVIVSLGLGGWAMAKWDEFLKFKNQVPFGETDPIFKKDVGFYVFSLPFYDFISWWVRVLLWLSVCLVAGLDAFLAYRESRYEVQITKRGFSHIAVLLLGLLVVSVWRSVICIWKLVYSPRGVVFGAGYTDIHAQLGAYKFYIDVIVLIAFAVVVWAFIRRWKMGVTILGTWVVSFVLIIWVYPGLFQYFVVRPNELTKETEYIQYNIQGTQKAYGLGDVQESERITKLATLEEIRQEQTVLENIRLWDPRALHDTLGQIQSIRLYYVFNDVDVDRYTLAGVYRQVMIGARELKQELLPEKAQTWVNKRLKYTHGYGVCLNPVNEFTSEGMPNLLVKDIPPQAVFEGLKVSRPEVYFGELTNDYVFVSTDEEEFDYSLGEQNVYTKAYSGKSGIVLGSGLRRLAFILKFGSLKIVISGQLKPESQMLWRRNVEERVKKLCPFLLYDADPYIVIGKSGKLWWLIDAYTVSKGGYPYSEPYQDIRGKTEGGTEYGQYHKLNYIRNSVKVAVDAYTGEVGFYVWDEKDALVRTYQRILPVLFKSKSEIPDGLEKHVRYPDDLMSIQARVYGVYHMRNPQVFYNREDQWDLAKEVYADDNPQEVIPYYVIVKLPGVEKEEFINMIPLTPRGKSNMVAWMCTRIDGESYGQLLIYKLPKGEIILGPEQIESRINQDTEISAKLTLWNQQGSKVIRGNLLVIPIADTLFFIKPLYLQATNAKMPELKQVIVAAGDKLAWGETFDSALERLFIGQITKAEGEAGVGAAMRTIEEIIKSAATNYKNYLRLMGEAKPKEAGQTLQMLGNDLEALAK